ncbi:MAG: acetyltransferase [Eubacterium sp.]|nr:acetyltransferase [Eubacterium sp.]
MNKLVLTGGGGHCLSVLDSIYDSCKYDEVLITDYQHPAGYRILKSVVVGDDSNLPSLYDSGVNSAHISVGNIKTTDIRRTLDKMLSEIGFSFPVIIDRTAVVSGNSEIGEGTFVAKHAVINVNSHIGRHSIINTSVVIEHECHIGDFVHVAGGSVICGNSSIGDDTFVGANSTIIQGLSIGKNVIIGAGSLVLRDVKDNETIYGIVK